MIIGAKKFENYTFVMGIINLTPDSFYAASRATADEVLFLAEKMVKEGASILDIGAQSTRPGYAEIGAKQEIARLEGVIYALKRNFDIPLSVDTYNAETARFVLECGADMINDIWGLTNDEMAKTVASFGAAACIMHNAKTPSPQHIWGVMDQFFPAALDRAQKFGIKKESIIIDGGIGFGKTLEQNCELLEGYEKLRKYGFPLLLGASRKSMFGGRVEDRLPATLAATRAAAQKGVLIVRVHDVKANVQAIREVYGG